MTAGSASEDAVPRICGPLPCPPMKLSLPASPSRSIDLNSRFPSGRSLSVQFLSFTFQDRPYTTIFFPTAVGDCPTAVSYPSNGGLHVMKLSFFVVPCFPCDVSWYAAPSFTHRLSFHPPQPVDCAMGFDPQLFAVKPCSEFLCTVCSEVLDKPMCVCQEGHTFCKACISRWLEKQQTCPTCRCAISQASLRPSRIVETLIGALDVCCHHSAKPNDDDGAHSSVCDSTSGQACAEEPAAKRQRMDNGCSWMGALRDLDGHLQSCGFVPDPCPLGCGASVQRRKLEEHSMCCPKRRVECEHCHEGMPYESLEEHVAVLCPMYLVPCMQQCGQTMPRKQLSAHLSTDCPLQPVDCLFMAQGCTVRPRRQSLLQHLSNSAVEHSMLSAERLQELEESMMELRNRHKELERLLTESARSDTFNVTWRITGVKGLVDAKQCIYSEAFPIACGGMYLELSFETDEDDIEWIGCYLSHTADCGKTHKIAGSSISFVLQSGNITETFDDGTKISGPGEGWSDFCKVAWLLEDDGWRLSGDDELQVELKLRLDDRHYHVNTYLPI